MDTFGNQLLIDLNRIIREKETTSVLWIVSQKIMREENNLIGDIFTADSLLSRTDAAYRIGIGYHINIQLPEKKANHLYALLRDQWCKTVYLYEDLQRQQYLATLGFRLLKTYENNALYYFDIYDYKQIPDWLNNRFWAHPQLWDKT